VASSNWARVREIFEQGLECPVEQRDAFLSEACAGDAELRASVEALLVADEQTTPFLDSPSKGAALSLVAEMLEPAQEVQQVGNYKLVKAIASGGMGSVYAAVRVDGEYDQQVAVKLIKPGMATEDILRRFRQERQTLARLDHPNIARILDGGAASNGSPYLVMEFIDGIPIHRYCDEHRMTIDQRLEVFRSACDAVEYAHRNLIVHRDLKPGNMLVTSDGNLKLLDFGISKLLDDSNGHVETLATEPANRLMTPQYASPEQIRGESITTVSDVYSLGVVLYELLAGRRPYQLKGRNPKESEQLICETEPAAPSAAVARPSGNGQVEQPTPLAISEARQTQPEKLRKRLRGDLDTIIFTAMHKDPNRRYASVGQLADDIHRYLTGLPVKARRDSLGYRLGKFATRHKVGVFASILVLVSITGGVIGTTVGMLRAQTEARTSERVTVFLQDMLAAADPSVEGKDITVRRVLDETSTRIETELADQPIVKSAVQHVLGVTYESLGEFELAEEHVRDALDVRRREFGMLNVHTISSVNALGSVRLSRGHPEEAQTLLTNARNALDELGLGNSEKAVHVISTLGKALQDTGDLKGAGVLFEESLRICLDAHGELHKNTLNSLNNLAALYAKQGKHDKAEPLYEELLEKSEKIFGENNPKPLAYANNLAALYFRQGRNDEAAAIYQRIVWGSRTVLGADNPRTLTAMSNLASVLIRLNRFDEAEQLYREVLDRRLDVLGPGHPGTLMTMNALGLYCRNHGKTSEAEQLLRQAVDDGGRELGRGHTQVLEAMNNLGLLLTDQGRFDEAQPLHLEAVQRSAEDLGEDDPQTLDFKHNLALLYVKLDRSSEAESLLKFLRAAHMERLGPDHPRVLGTQNNLAFLYLKEKRFEDALVVAQPLVDGYRKIRGMRDPQTLIATNQLARAHMGLGDYATALSLFAEIIETSDEVLPPGHWLGALFLGYQGECLMYMGRDEEAAETLARSHAVLLRTFGEDHERTQRVARIMEKLATP
jgi:serine/threonine-protein kinase